MDVLWFRGCFVRALPFHLSAWGNSVAGCAPLFFLDLAKGRLLGGLPHSHDRGGSQSQFDHCCYERVRFIANRRLPDWNIEMEA